MKGSLTQQVSNRVRKRRCIRRVGKLFDLPPRRLPHGRHDQQREEQTGNAGQKKRRPPAVVLGHPAAAEKSDEQSDIETGRIEREGAGAFLWRIEIRNNGIDRRRRPRLADARAEACKHQLPEFRGEAAQEGHHAEKRE